MTAAVLVADAAPVVACPSCGLDMPAVQIVCAWCHADGKHGNAADIHNRNARVTEAILWS